MPPWTANSQIQVVAKQLSNRFAIISTHWRSQSWLATPIQNPYPVRAIILWKKQRWMSNKLARFNPSTTTTNNRELKQPRRRRQQERHKFAYLTMKNTTFARFARAFFIFGHFADVLVLSTTWNDLFCSCPDDVSMWWKMFNFVSLPLKRWFQFNSRIVWTHFASVRTLNNSEMIAEIRSYIFIWRSCCRRRRVCLNSLIGSLRKHDVDGSENVIWKCNFSFLQSFLNCSRPSRLQNVF